MNSEICASSERSRGTTARDDVKPEENQWIESPIRLPHSPIGWVRLDEVDTMGVVLTRQVRC
jgi:hypothetical protein